MMGEANPQRGLFYQLSLESFVPAEHPLRAIRPLIDDAAIRRTCRDLYAPIGRPSIPVIRQDLARVAVETFERSVHLQRSAGEPGCRASVILSGQAHDQAKSLWEEIGATRAGFQ